MDKRKVHIAVSIMITAIFMLIGAVWCQDSYKRLWETLSGIGSSVVFFFRQILGIETPIKVEVLYPSKVLESVPSTLPQTQEEFSFRGKIYGKLLFERNNLLGYLGYVANKLLILAYAVMIAVPLVLILGMLVKRLYNMPNDRCNKDTFALSIFKTLAMHTYQPCKSALILYKRYLGEHPAWKKIWIFIWILNVNFASIFVAFISYYFYFAITLNFATLYQQFRNLFLDVGLVIRHFPWMITGTVVWILFCRFRERIARSILEYHEARDCGFIKELPIVSMTCGSMGKKKTTMTTDMALSQTVMFRQEAFKRLQKQDMKFPFFPWVCFERELQTCMEYGRVYNLASIRTWVAKKRDRYIKHGREDLQLYGYDVARYGLFYDSGLKQESLFEVLETYAKLYFIYVIESSLLVSNYSIREEEVVYGYNFPLREYSFFTPAVEYTRFAHILDFDILRLGRKVVANNPKAGSFEFGVVVITEVGKERANNLELKELKKGADETNQKNDLFNSWLKMCRHSATVDNYPFIKVFTDEQRPESWGADARDLADILTIVKSGKPKLALPFFTLEEWLYDHLFTKFLGMYYHLRSRRGDNTLLIHILKAVVSKIYAHCQRIYNRFGYSVLSIEKERGTQDGKAEKKKYFLADYKIYRERFSTDCFSDYFNDLAEKSGVGLRDYLEYKTVKASVAELRSQNSYFIRGLYGE